MQLRSQHHSTRKPCIWSSRPRDLPVNPMSLQYQCRRKTQYRNRYRIDLKNGIGPSLKYSLRVNCKNLFSRAVIYSLRHSSHELKLCLKMFVPFVRTHVVRGSIRGNHCL